MIKLSVNIMCSAFDKARVDNVNKIIKKLDDQKILKHWHKFKVIKDYEKKGAWHTAKKCWEYGAFCSSSHHLVLQDDIDVSINFVEGILKVIESNADDIITLFTMPRKKFLGKCRWGILEGVYGTGVIMPKYKLLKFLNWQQEHILPTFPHDDSRVSLFCKFNNYQVKVPFPNLVQHLDTSFKSILGNRWVKPRMSEHFIGNDDPLKIDWTDNGVYEKAINSYPPKKYYDYLVGL